MGCGCCCLIQIYVLDQFDLLIPGDRGWTCMVMSNFGHGQQNLIRRKIIVLQNIKKVYQLVPLVMIQSLVNGTTTELGHIGY